MWSLLLDACRERKAWYKLKDGRGPWSELTCYNLLILKANTCKCKICCTLEADCDELNKPKKSNDLGWVINLKSLKLEKQNLRREKKGSHYLAKFPQHKLN
jgi:hypothetical protein